jgi:hypothetical protein
MYESDPAFTDDQIQAMRAARPLAALIAEETLGYDPFKGQARRLTLTEADRSETTLILESPETTEITPFRSIWQPVLRGDVYTPYHRLDVINTGSVSVTNPVTQLCEVNHTMLIHRPQDDAIHGLGIVAVQPIQRRTTPDPAMEILLPFWIPGQDAQPLIVDRPGECRILDVADAQKLLQTVQLALERDDV